MLLSTGSFVSFKDLNYFLAKWGVGESTSFNDIHSTYQNSQVLTMVTPPIRFRSQTKATILIRTS